MALFRHHCQEKWVLNEKQARRENLPIQWNWSDLWNISIYGNKLANNGLVVLIHVFSHKFSLFYGNMCVISVTFWIKAAIPLNLVFFLELQDISESSANYQISIIDFGCYFVQFRT